MADGKWMIRDSNYLYCFRLLLFTDKKINSIRDEFAKQFLKPLHITTFTQNEIKAFEEFMSKNTCIKLL